jgi:hypothetical protein
MPDFVFYQNYLEAGIKEAERYLLSKNLFWTLNVIPVLGETGYPSLTLGSLLLYKVHAKLLARTPAQETAYQQIELQFNAIYTQWRVAWEKKSTWEFKSRLRQWGNFLKEIRVDPEDHIGYYRYEVRLRVILDLLRPYLRELDPAHQEHLESLDILLKALFAPGKFIWEPELASEFPVKDYWYLWGLLKEP